MWTELYASPRHPYTVALLSAVPEPDPAKREEAPRPQGRRAVALPIRRRAAASTRAAGCASSSGNPEICATVDPRLQIVGEGHAVACHFADRTQQEQERVATPVGEVA